MSENETSKLSISFIENYVSFANLCNGFLPRHLKKQHKRTCVVPCGKQQNTASTSEKFASLTAIISGKS